MSIITRKIEVFVCEDDKDVRAACYRKLYEVRRCAVKAANMMASHLFALDNTLPYLDEDGRNAVRFIGAKGEPVKSRGGAIYAVLSAEFKGKTDMAMISSVKQMVEKSYAADKKNGGSFEHSLRSYKSTLPVPYQKSQFKNLRFADYVGKDGKKKNGCFFELSGIPFQCRFGSDRSGNSLIVKRVISGEYKLRTSSISMEKDKKDKDKKKTFLHLSVEIPDKKADVNLKKTMYAFLGVMQPIACSTYVSVYRDYDSKFKGWRIGSAEEFNYRRREIQAARERMKINLKFAGKSGKRRLDAWKRRFSKKEHDYVETKLHKYSKELIDLAVKHGCGTIRLVGVQKEREEKAKEDGKKGNDFVVKNWSYGSLSQKIKYKAARVGIKVVDEDEEARKEEKKKKEAEIMARWAEAERKLDDRLTENEKLKIKKDKLMDEAKRRAAIADDLGSAVL